MTTFLSLFDLVTGRPLKAEAEGPAHRARILLSATLASVIFAGLYGLAAGSTDLTLALGNVYKLPMVILLSSVCAIPAAMLAWKLLGSRHDATDLLMGVVSGNFGATLVLVVLAPIVALYYHTSGYLGGTLAMGAHALALVTGLVLTVRAVRKRVPEGTPRSAVAVPVAVMMTIQLACLLQFVFIASPILPEVTVFDGGADAIVVK